MGAGRKPSRMNTSQPGQDNSSDYYGPDKFAQASREREAAAATRGRTNRMNSSQLVQDNSSDYFGLDKFDTLLRNLERGKERLNRRKERGMLM